MTQVLEIYFLTFVRLFEKKMLILVWIFFILKLVLVFYIEISVVIFILKLVWIFVY